jgi:UDP-glucose 4-epimerase
MSSALVVGGNGFLGSHVVDELVARGHEVTAFDRFSSPLAFESPEVRRITGDFLDTGALRRALVGQDQLFHFISTTTPASSDRDPTLDIRTNVAQSVELFRMAVDAGVSRVLFASTGGSIYGDQATDRITEDAVPAPVSPYAIGKQAIEGFLRYFERTHGLRSVALRISNPYGPRQHPDKKQGVIPIFLQRIAGGQPIEVLGDTATVRDYIFAPDAARLVATIADAEPAHDVYNIGSGQGTTLGEVIELARTVSGRDVEQVHLAAPATFVQRSVLDIHRFRSEFGDPQFVSLEEGMATTWRATLERGT